MSLNICHYISYIDDVLSDKISQTVRSWISHTELGNNFSNTPKHLYCCSYHHIRTSNRRVVLWVKREKVVNKMQNSTTALPYKLLQIFRLLFDQWTFISWCYFVQSIYLSDDPGSKGNVSKFLLVIGKMLWKNKINK